MNIYRIVDKSNKKKIFLFLTIKERVLYKIVHREFVIMGVRNYYCQLIGLNCFITHENEIIPKVLSNGFLVKEFSLESVEILGIEKLQRTFGEFYPRLFRPFPYTPHESQMTNERIDQIEGLIYEETAFDPNNNNSIVNSINQLAILTNQLKEILDVIRPEKENLQVFGDEIKNLLILSCIEVENQFKSVLRANIYVSKSKNLTTRDYVKLKDILKLKDYSIHFPFYPNLQIDNPFRNWSCKKRQTSETIKWYKSYNSVKHDSELNISMATLEMALQAISALAILIVAQFGYSPLYWKERIGNFYDITNHTIWDSEELIFAPLAYEPWIEIKQNINSCMEQA